MPEIQPVLGLQALSDALSDAAEIHCAAAEVANVPDLKARLTNRHHCLQRLCREVRESVSDDEPGSMLQLLDRLRLSVDRLFGDNDAAADGASRESIRSLLALIDDHLRDPELSPDVRAVFAAVRERVAPGERPHTEDTGLRSLPS